MTSLSAALQDHAESHRNSYLSDGTDSIFLHQFEQNVYLDVSGKMGGPYANIQRGPTSTTSLFQAEVTQKGPPYLPVNHQRKNSKF